MATPRHLVRPATRLITAASSSAPLQQLPLVSSRGHKTAARTKRALKIAPHDSFLPSRAAVFPTADSIIYNPPASESSPFHTPLLFLPRGDPRRIALIRRDAVAATAASVPAAAEGELPPSMRYRRRNPQYHLTKDDVAEMKKLRAEDPLKWSVNQLAQKFNCSTVFVRMAAPAPPEHLEWVQGKLERKKARWGPLKTDAREDRKRRSEMMYRGEL